MGLLDVSQEAQFKYYRECGYKNNPIVSLEKLDIKGALKSMNTSFYYMEQDDFEKGEEKETLFDREGRITKEVTTKYDINTQISTKDWMYEGDKLILLESVNGKNSLKTSYLYNQDIFVGKKQRAANEVVSFVNYLYGDNIVIVETFNKMGKIETRTKRAYDEKGNEIETLLSFNFFDNHHRYTYQYDQCGRLVKSDKYDCDNNLSDSVLYEYNEQNNLIKTTNTITELILDYRYEYDSMNNWIVKQVYNGGELQSFWEREFEYC